MVRSLENMPTRAVFNTAIALGQIGVRPDLDVLAQKRGRYGVEAELSLSGNWDHLRLPRLVGRFCIFFFVSGVNCIVHAIWIKITAMAAQISARTSF